MVSGKFNEVFALELSLQGIFSMTKLVLCRG